MGTVPSIGYREQPHKMAVPLIVSCLFIALSCLIAELVRIVINKVLADKPLPRVLCHEFVATAELCAVCFEMGIVADVYGVWTYAVLLFVLTLWWAAHCKMRRHVLTFT